MQKIILLTTILLCHATASIAETRLTLAPSLLYFDYTEFSTSNEVLDRELGWLPGIEFDLSHKFASDWSVNIIGAYYQGIVDYTGQTQTGIPLTTNTDTRLFRFGGRIEKGIYKKIRLFASAQQHQWNRDINNTNIASGINEIYRWLEYSIGLNSDIYSNEKNLINIDIAYLVTRNATIDVDLSRVDLGSTQLDIGNGSGGRIKLNWKTAYTDKTHLGLSVFFEAWNFGRSNTKATEGGTSSVLVTEPRSETRNTGLKLTIEYLF